jgi:hypothetical protein
MTSRQWLQCSNSREGIAFYGDSRRTGGQWCVAVIEGSIGSSETHCTAAREISPLNNPRNGFQSRANKAIARCIDRLSVTDRWSVTTGNRSTILVPDGWHPSNWQLLVSAAFLVALLDGTSTRSRFRYLRFDFRSRVWRSQSPLRSRLAARRSQR